MSYCTRAILAAKSAVSAPKIDTIGRPHFDSLIIGEHRNSKNTPATTIVELCRRAETGVGPSIAAGNQGCKENCADFPAAAKIIPIVAIFISLGIFR
tara:strand:+ start:1396 stop:1686 length:291 start_codon:yes stop_codon:yes gene_type:complete